MVETLGYAGRASIGIVNNQIRSHLVAFWHQGPESSQGKWVSWSTSGLLEQTQQERLDRRPPALGLVVVDDVAGRGHLGITAVGQSSGHLA